MFCTATLRCCGCWSKLFESAVDALRDSVSQKHSAARTLTEKGIADKL